MKAEDLIKELQKCPPDAEVFVEVEVESGFYDVPARHAQGRVYYTQHLDWVEHNRVTLLAKKA